MGRRGSVSLPGQPSLEQRRAAAERHLPDISDEDIREGILSALERSARERWYFAEAMPVPMRRIAAVLEGLIVEGLVERSSSPAMNVLFRLKLQVEARTVESTPPRQAAPPAFPVKTPGVTRQRQAEAPSESWWIGLSREQFNAAVDTRARDMRPVKQWGHDRRIVMRVGEA